MANLNEIKCLWTQAEWAHGLQRQRNERIAAPRRDFGGAQVVLYDGDVFESACHFPGLVATSNSAILRISGPKNADSGWVQLDRNTGIRPNATA